MALTIAPALAYTLLTSMPTGSLAASVQLLRSSEGHELLERSQLPTWHSLGEHQVPMDEGPGLITVNGDLEFCQLICSNYKGCLSFAMCGTQCYLKAQALTADTPAVHKSDCTTHYKTSAPETTTTEEPEEPQAPATTQQPDQGEAETTAPAMPADAPATTTPAKTTPATTTPASPPAAKEIECRKFEAKILVNELQQFSGNPDSEITGLAAMTLCTNGTVHADLHMDGGTSEIIATHVHHCQGGDSYQTKTAALCAGPPVLNFCGSNARGMIADGFEYSRTCAGYTDSVSETKDIPGVLIAKHEDDTMEDLIRDIFDRPNNYYFNVHTMASYNHWYPHHEGAARGPVKLAVDPDATTTPPPEIVDDACYSFFSQMAMNELQKYGGNPDSAARGYANFQLCTNGTLRGTMLLFGGVSEIIASHIHHCKGGDTAQTRTAELCAGPPVLNFCGSNAAGLLNDGTDYPTSCNAYENGASRSVMEGSLIAGMNHGTSMAQRVSDIARNPTQYYFNAHTMASYNHWYPGHQGMCRGPMELSR